MLLLLRKGNAKILIVVIDIIYLFGVHNNGLKVWKYIIQWMNNQNDYQLANYSITQVSN